MLIRCTTEVIPLTPSGTPLRLREEGGKTRPCTLALQLCYDFADPLAVSLRFETREQVSWTFSRDLLADGCLSPVGAGDVQVAPTGRGVCLTLFPGEDRQSRFFIEADALESFLEESYALVPRGREAPTPALERVLAEILATGLSG